MQPRNSSASALGLLCHSKSCCKQQIPASHHRYTTASCAPARRDVDRVFCPLVRSFLRVASPGQYALMLWLFSCRCDSSFRDGRRPGRFVLRSPGSAFPIRNRGFLRVGGDAPQSAHRGMEPESCLYKSVPMQIVYLFIMEQFLRWQTAAQLPAPPLQLLFWRRSLRRVPA